MTQTINLCEKANCVLPWLLTAEKLQIPYQITLILGSLTDIGQIQQGKILDNWHIVEHCE